MNITNFPPEDDYIVLFYANWDIASNQFQSTYLNVAQTVTANDLYHSHKEYRKIIFAKFSCGKYPHICSKYHLHNIPAILFFTNVILEESSETGIPHSTRYLGNLNLYEQIQDFVEIWRSIGTLIRLYGKTPSKFINIWNICTKRLNEIIPK
ncbi:conserved Plasmodium protein, unknown function [Babesia microti strain RI]|uniref:Uncharacterized protein n=1 Tax=Babesia microti (strain RI) TaxID=1133968 RepID=I7I9W0_BABMR|nr:conserved Plasmodium protein, unknown function [Babesia microti strain RI]CCF75724.1 conserved Plasmodium protein, unknown function [Babesia microti strain RI]|eukprot:XP_012650132.1 conserved Plasmodium protein, unknown function [Babesia microti strain RI]